MDETQLARIREMEGNLNACVAATEALSARLEEMDALRERTIALTRYYGSADWYADREAPLPPDVPAGVLSEDAVYDEIVRLRETAVRMLELATDILRDRL